MEFKHLSQPDFERERDGAVRKANEEIWEHTKGGLPPINTIARKTYNEGYKQALRDWSIWKDGSQRIGCMQHDIKEIIADVDKIDKE